jgi:hypothetical protein
MQRPYHFHQHRRFITAKHSAAVPPVDCRHGLLIFELIREDEVYHGCCDHDIRGENQCAVEWSDTAPQVDEIGPTVGTSTASTQSVSFRGSSEYIHIRGDCLNCHRCSQKDVQCGCNCRSTHISQRLPELGLSIGSNIVLASAPNSEITSRTFEY